MKTENKMSELRIAARNAHSAEIDAAASRNAAWKVYIDAAEFIYAARETAQREAAASQDSNWDAYVSASEILRAAEDFSEKTQKDADDFETGDYETLDYDPVGK